MARTATLEFELPTDVEQFHVATHAADLYLSLWGMDQWLRDRIKNGPVASAPTLQACRDELHCILTDRGVNLEMML